MNRTVHRRMLLSMLRVERRLEAAHARAESRRQSAWRRLADLRAEQAQLDLSIAHLRRHYYQPPPPPAPEISFSYETVAPCTGEHAPAEDVGGPSLLAAPHPAPDAACSPSVQGEPRRLKDGWLERSANGRRRPPTEQERTLAIWAKL